MTTCSDPTRRKARGNQPPRTAFPTLPALRPLPQIVDPDSWLDGLHGWHVERKVDAHGMVKIERTALLRREQARRPAPHLAAGCKDPLAACLPRNPAPQIRADHTKCLRPTAWEAVSKAWSVICSPLNSSWPICELKPRRNTACAARPRTPLAHGCSRFSLARCFCLLARLRGADTPAVTRCVTRTGCFLA